MKEPTNRDIKDRRHLGRRAASVTRTDNLLKPSTWPISRERQRLLWFPARQRLISLVRGSRDSFVLPPAVVRKASWRE